MSKISAKSTESAPPSASVVREIELLTLDQCRQARDKIHELSPLWDEERYRLGAGISYYKPQHLYYAMARQFNPILRRHFGWLYELLLAGLQDDLGAPVRFRDDLALPGFNIYCGQIEFERIAYNVHVDLQFNDLSWEPPGSADFSKTLSFTLPLALPTRGGGLNFWEARREDLKHCQDPLASGKLDSHLAGYHSYRLGVLAVHDGCHYHQMVVAPETADQDERITLQGHGLFQSGSWVIYG